jgi:hypothetical protein
VECAHIWEFFTDRIIAGLAKFLILEQIVLGVAEELDLLQIRGRGEQRRQVLEFLTLTKYPELAFGIPIVRLVVLHQLKISKLLSESRSGVFSETHELTVAVLAIFCKVIELLKELRYMANAPDMSVKMSVLFNPLERFFDWKDVNFLKR